MTHAMDRTSSSMLTMNDGTELFHRDWGTGQPVVLIHGWPLSGDSWDSVAVPLVEAGFRTIAYDRRGFGRSSQPWNGYDYDTFADDLAAVLEQTGARDAVLVGFSMGGGEVARYMSRHNGRGVSKAVLISSVVPFMLKTADNPAGMEQAIFDKVAMGIREDRARFFKGFFKDFFGVGAISHPVSEELMHMAWNTAMQASLRSTLAAAKAFSSTDFRPDLASFRVPTLIIHGTEDKTVPIDATGRAAAKGISGSTLIEYNGSPHGVFATDRERLTQDLLSFLSR